ncbi:hypothetical protein HS088_TW06G00765 [Tripterygium wilfordii]|uniref:Pentatricopeptide repeat-containing protein n=1 Tax=Tripterygium wilfordii TaxID=458696 RepID=A0A7J7DK24_TRIWF|nr:pentatricopeptide repeat-containing protein At1g74600, chloroplastic [Tripterygium wilfordii]KAF5746594.1 hypothetical protein HS088_TW06G00765 [Tripterygium wilfordii]
MPNFLKNGSKLFSHVRTITTEHRAVPSPVPFMQLDSYCEVNRDEDVYSKNRVIGNLVKCGSLKHALNVFDEMPVCDVVTYNLLISGHGRYGQPKAAFNLYADMVSLGIRESATTFSSVLSICSDAGLFREGIPVHCRVLKLGFSLNLFIGSSLIDLYLHKGLDKVALRLFDEVPERSLALWNLFLREFCELGKSEEVLRFYNKMKQDNVRPNGLSFCYLIRGCCNESFLHDGKKLHCHIIKIGLVKSNIFLSNALVDFYSACGNLIDAMKSFEVLEREDVLSWNSIVSICAYKGLLVDALEWFSCMQFHGKRPSIRSFVGLLNASSGTRNILLGKQIHCLILKMGFDPGSIHVQSALIDMYGKCGNIESSVLMYQSAPERTLECCNSLMTSLMHCGIVEDVIELFGLMVDEGIGLSEVTFSTTLKALSMCASPSLHSCQLLHSCAIKFGFESDVAVSCSLIDAYSRCGHVELSLEIFERLPSPNVFCFTSIINGCAWNGMGREGLGMLEMMIQKGLKPDWVTFLCVLTGCNHAGLVEEGRSVFNSMRSLYDIHPDRQHYACMVDLLGRAGLLDEAVELLQQAAGKGDSVMWSSLLRSCRVHGNERVGKIAAKTLMELELDDFSIYLQVSNFYSGIGEFEASEQVTENCTARKVTKQIGQSLIEVTVCV